jgi:hypothetical protein
MPTNISSAEIQFSVKTGGICCGDEIYCIHVNAQTQTSNEYQELHIDRTLSDFIMLRSSLIQKNICVADFSFPKDFYFKKKRINSLNKFLKLSLVFFSPHPDELGCEQ